MNPKPDENSVIRITMADVQSPHVDDLLSRQASLRGEGITASRHRKWYYSNWFVFMVAGTLGALIAWALLEPFFDDLLYLQGKVTLQRAIGKLPDQIEVDGQQIDLAQLAELIQGKIKVGDEAVLICRETQRLNAPPDEKRFDLRSLKDGQEIGVYVDRSTGGETPLLALFVDTEPTPGKATTKPVETLMRQQQIVSLLLFFPLVAALVGLCIGAADGLVCRLWRRVLLGGAVGLVVGFIGGFVFTILAELVYHPMHLLANKQSEGFGQMSHFGFLLQTIGRGLAWCLAGMAMGLGQGIALRSGRLLLYGFLGGAIGGMLGGLLFDPIDLVLLGPDKPSAHISRLVGLLVIGASVGVMIGIVELLARDAWLRMVQGPLSGKEFLIFKDAVAVGASPRSDIYLFNDDLVADRHAVIRAAADQYEIEAVNERCPVMVNGRAVRRTRLRHGDEIALGKTVFTFQRRQTQ